MSENAESNAEPKAVVPTTHVVGFFNPNTWPIQVAISELNLSVRLEPMQFVLDRRTGKKINDPILDQYVGPKMLSPELSDKAVPIIKIPIVAAPVSARTGYVIGQIPKDKTGRWQMSAAPTQSALPATTPQGTPIAASLPSIRAMSVEEARKQGLIGKPRFVPEDFGASEMDGAPVEGARIPRIRYAMESKPRAAIAQPTPLPQELIEQVNPKVAPILKGLEAAAARNPESISLGRQAAETAVSQQMGQAGVQQFRQQVKAVRAQAAAVPRPALPASSAPAVPRKRVAQPMAAAAAETIAAPDAEPESAEPEPATENPLMGGRVALPSPDMSDSENSGRITAEDRTGGPIRCGGCGKEFKYKSWYVRHVNMVHKDRITELMPAQAP